MKSQVDQHRSERAFNIGDMVFLKLQPYRQVSTSGGIPPKLAPKFYGPFQVVDNIGKVAYKPTFLEKAQIHDIFHVSQLKKAYGNVEQIIPLPMDSN